MNDVRDEFIDEATWHGSLHRAEAILAAHPELADQDIHTAAIVGNDAAVRRFLELDPGSVHARSGPFNADALNYLGLSKYLRLDPSRTPAFLRAATALLDAGADPNTGFWNKGEFETAMYGAAGVAHHPEMTKLLLEQGADPNDGEVVYHSPETDDNRALHLLVETGKITDENLVMMLIRKLDYHDPDGVRYLLEHGAKPNHARERGWSPLHHSLARSNDLEILDLLLDHGADPSIAEDGLTAVARAAREGRDDVLASLERRGVSVELTGVDELAAACARADASSVQTIIEREPQVLDALFAMRDTLLARFTINWNTKGVRQLLDLGVDVATPYVKGDGYFGIPPNSLAIHIAAWIAVPPLVKVLIERGSPIDAPDPKGRTPLALAVSATVDSWWTERRSPESVIALLEAGASAQSAPYPSGYDEVDEVLRRYRG